MPHSARSPHSPLVRRKIVAYRAARVLVAVASDLYPGYVAALAQVLERLRPARHSPCFRSVRWFGADYHFTATQAAVVEVLWREWQRGTPRVQEGAILDEIESDAAHVRDLFRRRGRRHPAWGTMIVQEDACLRLSVPSDWPAGLPA